MEYQNQTHYFDPVLHKKIYSILAIIEGLFASFGNGLIVYCTFIDRKLLTSHTNILIGALSSHQLISALANIAVSLVKKVIFIKKDVSVA